MNQQIKYDLNDTQYVFVEWKGHMTKLKDDDMEFVRRSAKPFVDKLIAEKVRKHYCPDCKSFPEDRSLHALKMVLNKLHGKPVGSF